VRLVVGLGNPGARYHLTRHNLGFLALDRFASGYGFDLSRRKHSALFSQGICCGEECVLIKPQTFMNKSGEAVRAFADHHHLSPEDIVVVCDDIHLRFGFLRIRRAGSSGGHNGLRSVAEQMESDEFTRLRLGVGEPDPETQDLVDYVLSPFSGEELERLPVFLDHASKALALLLQGDTNTAMNVYHGRDCTQA